MAEEKQCTRCKENKSLSAFKKVKRNKSGYLAYCKKCDPQNSYEHRKFQAIKTNYGLTKDDWNTMRKEQDYKCSICGKHELDCPRNTLFVDHCHSSGTVRKLLCSNCNAGLGQFKDDPELLIRAHQYLRDHKH